MKDSFNLITEENELAVEVIAHEVAERMNQIRSYEDAVSAVMYLRSLVGTDFDAEFHRIMRRIGDNRKKQELLVIE